MKRVEMLIAVFGLLVLVVGWGTPVVPIEPAESDVFLVYSPTNRPDGMTPLSGFRVRIEDSPAKRAGIITALHGVMGAIEAKDEIKAIRNVGKRYGSAVWTESRLLPVRVTMASVKHDIAYLEGPGCTAGHLRVARTKPVHPGDVVQVWGHPAGMKLHKRTMIIGDPSPAPLSDFLLTPFDSELEQRASPDVNLQVISLEGMLIGGHSGAPVLNSQREVIGIGSGGNLDKYGRLGISWAIPLADALKALRPLDVEGSNIAKLARRQHKITLSAKVSALKRRVSPFGLINEFFSMDYIPISEAEDGRPLTPLELAESLETRADLPLLRYELAIAITHAFAFRRFDPNFDPDVVYSSRSQGSGPFADVPQSHPAYQSVMELAQLGILTGTPEGMFQGKHVLTRYELARAVNSYFQYINRALAEEESKRPGYKPSSARKRTPLVPKFLDVPAEHWAADAVNQTVALGMLEQYPGPTFRGDEVASSRNVTRAIREVNAYVLDMLGDTALKPAPGN